MKPKIFAVLLCLFALNNTSSAMSPAPPSPPSLETIRQIAEQELIKLDKATAAAAQELSLTGLTGPQANQVLRDLYHRIQSAVDCVAISPDGRLVAIQPEIYHKALGENISSQPHFIIMQQERRPVLSDIFKTVEDFNAVSLAHPVFLPDGEFLGSVSIVFRPDALLAPAVKPLVAAHQIEIMLLQPNGLILYDRDRNQIGRQTFTDPVYQNYPELLALAHRVGTEEDGRGEYFFPGADGQPLKKQASWTTVRLHGNAWRILLSGPAE
jgi:hypothetical protein